MTRNLAEEAAEVLAAARAALGELVEEGLDRTPPTAKQAIPVPERRHSRRFAPSSASAPAAASARAAPRSSSATAIPTRTCCSSARGRASRRTAEDVPFVGRAGELLTQMIEKGLGIPRSEVYICNIVKCRPPGNRNPQAEEVTACRPFLDGQIDAVRPG